jgi:small-conductance mechanosensitive channel
VTIPNSKIVTNIVHNYSLPNPQVRVQIPISVSIAVDIERIKRILSEITDEALKIRPDLIAPDPKPTVYLMKIEKSTLTFIVTVFAQGFQYTTIIQDYLNIRIIERFGKEGIIIF